LAITKQIGKEEANKKAVSFAQKGKKKSKAHCLALSIAHKGQKSSLGFKHTMESRKNMSLAHRSKRTPRTEATKAKISATKMGHFVSEETKKKISNTKKAKYHDSRCKKTFY
jgi:hypothetical protein